MATVRGISIWAGIINLAALLAASTASAVISVPVRTEARADAPVAETVSLYKKSYALVIGNDTYTGPWPRLSNAVKDARLVKEALEAKGFEVTFRTNVTSREMVEAFEAFFLETGEDPDARLFVWYAGHGYSERGEGYLVPVDAPDTSEGGRFRRKALSLRRMGEYARDALALHIFAVFDSCFAGTIFNVGRDKPPPVITRATTRPVRQFLTSGDAGQAVSDDGTFRKLFLRAIAGEVPADANSDGFLSASELGLFLSGEITNYSNGTQTPRSGKLNDPELNQGDFIFQLAGGRSAQVAANPDKEALFWQSIQGSDNPAMYRAYLSQFPNGAFVPLAHLKISELQKVQQVSRAKPPRVEIRPKPATPAAGVFPRQAESFKDCPNCPEMVRIPAGTFRMGHIQDVGAAYTKPARPVREVGIEFPFAMSRYEVTFDEYDRFTDAKGRPRLADKGWGRGRLPALRMSRVDAIAYTKWLTEKTGKYYRLPTEAEWEYAARGGKETNFWWGDSTDPNRANFGVGVTGWLPAPFVKDGDKYPNTSPVGAFPPNPFGLYDMHGNVWEYVEDCYHDGYVGAPDDGSARLDAPKSELDEEDDPTRECEIFTMRGGSSGYNHYYGMSATRIGINWAVVGYLHYGIRLVRDLE